MKNTCFTAGIFHFNGFLHRDSLGNLVTWRQNRVKKLFSLTVIARSRSDAVIATLH
jgi:hypothetical protein